MHSAHIALPPNSAQMRIQTCAEHSRSVAEMARAHLEGCGLGNTGYLAGLLHDCGKFTGEFDAYLQKSVRGEPVKKGSVIHTFAGLRYLLTQFHSRDGKLSFSDITAEIIGVGIAGHHGLIDLWDEYHQNAFDHRLNRQPDYDDRAVADFQRECASFEEIQALFQRADGEVMDFYRRKLVLGVRREKEAYFALGLMVRLITSAIVDADRTDTRCFMENVPLPPVKMQMWASCVDSINAYVAAFPGVTPIQAARRVFSDQCAAEARRTPGLYRLDLPTGGGKTLAALRFAAIHAQKNSLCRIIYTAPLLSIIEQNAGVIRSAVGDTVSVLEHHSNLVVDTSSPEDMAQTELLQENWDAQIVITTFVQLLNTLFSGKMASVRRFHCLCQSVIIIDEVQSLPNKLLSMFNMAINFLVKCCGATVVLCSATQPAFERADHKMVNCERLIGEALLEKYGPLFQRTVIRYGGSCSMAELADRGRAILESADSLLVVCNTKGEAAELYQAMCDISDVKAFHLSAGMCMAHRKAVLEKVNRALDTGEKIICISTQLIEAGVDVSFGAVIRLAAGLDNIVQAAGRCNRHGEHSEFRPVDIYHLKGERLGPLKEIQDAQNALNILLDAFRRNPERYNNDLTSDAAIHDYYAALYRQMARGAQDYSTHGQTLFELLSTNVHFAAEQMPMYYLNQAFRTAGEWFEVFDSANESVLVPYGEGANLIEQLDTPRAKYDVCYAADLLQKAKPYAVSMTVHQISAMAQRGMIYTMLDGSVYALNAGYYDDHLGVREGKDVCDTLIL